MGTNKLKDPSKRPISDGKSGLRTRKRAKLVQNRGETDDSTDETTLDDLQCEGAPEQEEEEENEVEYEVENEDEEEEEGEEDIEEEEKRKNFMKEPAWTEFRKGSPEDQVKRCRAVCKLAFTDSLRNIYNVPADLQLEKNASKWLHTYKKDSHWSESTKRTWAVYSFFRSVDSKHVEEVMLTIGKRGRSRGRAIRSTSTNQSNSQNPTASLKADANETARLFHIRAALPHLFEELDNPWADSATLDNESSGGAQRESTLWAEIAKEFFNSENTYENVCKDGMCTADLKRKVETLDPNKFQQRSGVTPGSWIQGAWKHVVNRLSLHYSAWDVSGNQDEFSPDAWHKFEVGHKSRAGAADHSEERGTSPAHSNTCTAACLYAPFVFTTKEAMNAIVAPKEQIDSGWEGRSSATSSVTKSETSTGGRDIDKTLKNVAETSTRLLQTLMRNLTEAEDSSATKLRLFADILKNANVDEANKVRARSLMASLLQAQVDAITADADNS